MTLDVFMARPNDEIDWAFKYSPDEMSQEIMAEIGAVLIGTGIRLFDHLKEGDIELERIGLDTTTQGLTSLRFRVIKS